MAMASPCEVRVDTDDASLGKWAGQLAQGEALRIEAKYSRYRESVITKINQRAGQAMDVDEETADLLDFAAECYRLSEGMFDITSGVLRRAWKFDGSNRVPAAEQITPLLELMGWDKICWQRPMLKLRPGMEIDFGGIGKEYAVDRALSLITSQSACAALVNFGGDLRASRAKHDGSPWRVAIESVDSPGATDGLLAIGAGALATSGDAHRYLLRDQVRYGHVLNPKTGWPVADAPRSVTVLSTTCITAGLIAKLALFAGKHAEDFLATEGVRAWCMR